MKVSTLKLKKKHGLTGKEAQLIEELPKHDFNQTKAGKAAGYAPKSAHVQAHRAIMKDKVQNALAEMARDSITLNDLTPDMIAGGLLKEAQGAQTDGARVRAYELLGKTKRMFADTIVNEGEGVEIASLLDQIRQASPEIADLLEADLGTISGVEVGKEGD